MAVWMMRAGLGLAAAAFCAASAGASTMTFGDGCERGRNIVVAGVGDLLFHNRLQRLALRPGRDYTQFVSKMEPVLAGADITYGNLEGPTAEGLAAGGQAARDPGRRFDGRVYGYRPPLLAFNFHPSVLGDLKSVGFDVLSTANNHSLDRGGLGVERTIANIEATGLAFTGTRTRQPGAGHVWATRVAAQDVTVSFIACTTFTNGWPDPKGQVLKCQSDAFVAEIRREAADRDVDAVIVTPHWGWENHHNPNAEQKAIAHRAVDVGADVVFGAHPHVLQPWEKRMTADGREALIVYSLGNFISNQVRQPQRVGAVALARFTKIAEGRAALTGVGYIPTWVVKDGNGVRVTESGGGSWARGHAAREDAAALCAACAAQLSSEQALDAAHLTCLQESAWTQEPAVQVAAFRLLSRLAQETADAAPWAADLLDQLYLEDDVRAWAKAAPRAATEPAPEHRDSNGAPLAHGDTVTLIKDLPVKGAGFTAKRGTAVRNISLAPDNPHHIEGRVEGQRIVILTQFVKKSG